MLVLALETASRAGGVALGWREAGELVVRSAPLGSSAAHARDLLPCAAELLGAAGRTAAELTDVVVDVGPGSYTGLRVGVATALGLAVGPAPPRLVGVPAPEALLAAALGPGEAGTWLQDGRSGAWYHARGTRSAAGVLALTTAPELVPDADLPALLAGLDPAERLLADAASCARLGELAPEALGARSAPDQRGVDPEVLLRRGLERLASDGPTPPGELVPLYLRPFAAQVRRR